MKARESKVTQSRLSAMLSGDDVVEWEGDRGIKPLRHEAVFTGVLCPLTNFLRKGLVHEATPAKKLSS